MMPVGLGNLTSLQYLSTFRVGHDDGEMKSAKLNELKELNSLRHELCIKNLERVRDVEEEMKEVNLKEKKHLCCLDLSWKPGTNKDNGIDSSVLLLEKLCPHQNLKQLSLDYCPGVRVSDWLSSLTSIVQITFFGCVNCRCLPPLERLPSLKYLSMNGMDALEYIEYDEIPTSTSMFFPSLEDLTIYNCPNLKGWQHRMLLGNDVMALPPFPCLSLLTIRRCPNLTRMPKFPRLVEGLVLGSCSVEPLTETILEDHQSFVAPLSLLKYMRISDIQTESLPEDWMRNLICLEKLEVVGIPSLKHMQHLPCAGALQDLLIRDMVVDNLECRFLHCLASLQTLTISHCHNLKDMPEWICSFPLLQLLHIHYCRSLGSLPEDMPCLTNLCTLEIIGCPLLHESCKRETGADWHKIAHISHITLND